MIEYKPTVLRPYVFYVSKRKEVFSSFGIATYGGKQTQPINKGFTTTYCY